jgi:hypothetical protein
MSKLKKVRGSAFGLALVAMLAFGAFAASAAQASPVWHYNGKTLKEAGLTELQYLIADGVLTFEMPRWGLTVSCDEAFGTGSVKGDGSGTGIIEAYGCETQEYEEVCYVAEPLAISVKLGLKAGGKTGVIETFTPTYTTMTSLEFSGEVCPLAEWSFDVMNPKGEGFAFEVGPEGNQVPLTSLGPITGSTGEEVVYVSLDGPIVQQAAGGGKIGAW